MSFAIKVINLYQKYISPLTGSNCRFYPTCSEYSKWLFTNTDVITATFKTTTRILRCNQLFEGGIDYPKIKFKPKKIEYGKIIDIKFWIVPYNKDIYYIIKVLKD
jgi:putative membrane protein insertion efficiency factor